MICTRFREFKQNIFDNQQKKIVKRRYQSSVYFLIRPQYRDESWSIVLYRFGLLSVLQQVLIVIETMKIKSLPSDRSGGMTLSLSLFINQFSSFIHRNQSNISFRFVLIETPRSSISSEPFQTLLIPYTSGSQPELHGPSVEGDTKSPPR